MSQVTPFTAGAIPAPRGFLSKLFLQAKPTEAQRSIVNRLATEPVSAITNAMIGEDLRAFGVRGKDAREVLASVWREAVAAFLDDNTISGDEAQYLTELRRALGLTDVELTAVEDQLVRSRFSDAVDEAIRDDELSTSDRARLDGLAQALRVPKELADGILMQRRQARIHAAAEAAAADRRLSPQESADLYALARSLGVELTFDDHTQAMFDRYALLWRIENGQFPVVNVPINLQRGESCHAVADATWMEMRTRTERYNYGGPVASIRICKGLRYRVGSVKVQRITRDELTEIDRGRIYLTNKRIIFDGAKQNKVIRLNAILSFTPYADGLVLEKASGRAPHLLLQGDVEVFLSVLGGVLAQSS